MGMDGVATWLILVRGGHDAALLALFGALAVPLLMPAEIRPHLAAPLAPRLAALLGFLLGLAWFLGVAGSVSDAHGPAALFAAVPDFIRFLPFARVLLLRLVLLAAAFLLAGRPRLTLPCAAAALFCQPWLGHPGEVGPDLIASEMLHLLAAGLWLGGLAPLLICLGRCAHEAAARAFRRFTFVALPSVVALAGTGLVLVLTGGAALQATAYGRIALAKVALLAIALVFACWNAALLTPRLRRAPDAAAALRVSVLIEMALGLGIVLLAGR